MAKIWTPDSKDKYLIPSEEEILSVSWFLWIEEDKIWVYMQEASELISELTAIKHENPAKYIAVAGRTWENIDTAILSGLFWADFNFSKLCSKWFISEDNTSEYFCISQNWSTYSRAAQKRFLSHFSRLDINELDIKTQSWIWLIILAEYKVRWEISSALGKRFLSITKFLLLYPSYIQSLSQSDQTLFFKLWFLSWEETSASLTKESELWRYLLKYFWELKFIREHLDASTSANTQKVIEDTRQAAANNITGEKITNLPNTQELEMIYDIYGFPAEWNSRRSYTKFLESVSEINTTNTAWKPVKRLMLAGIYKPELNFKSSEAILVLDEITSKRDLYALEQFTQKVALTANNRKKIKAYLISNLREFSYEDLAIVSLIAVKIITISPIQEDELINIVRKASVFIVAYPHYIKSLSENRQSDFFNVFLRSFTNQALVTDIDSSLLGYVLKHFSHVKSVRDYYKLLLSEKQDRLDNIWNRLTSIWDNSYKHSADIYNSVEEIDDISITKTHWNTIKFSETPEISNGKTIHIVIYNKSKSNKNIIAPQFYTIQPNQSELEIKSGPWKYSYVAFSHKRSTAFHSPKDLPKEVNWFKVQNFTSKWNKQSETQKIKKHPISQSSKAKVNRPKIHITPPWELDKKIEIDIEALQIWIALMFDSLTYKLEDNWLLTFIVPEWAWVIAGSWYAGIHNSREIRFDISTIPARLVSFLWIDNFEITDPDLLHIVHGRMHKIEREFLENKNRENKRQSSEIIRGLPDLPEKYQVSRDFLRGCDSTDLYDLKNSQIYYLWQLPFWEKLENQLKEDMESIWFHIEINKKQSIARTIKISAIDNPGVYACFDLGTWVDYTDLDIIEGQHTSVDLWVLKYVLQNVLARIVYEKYKLSARTKQRKKIETRNEARKKMRSSVADKVNLWTASLVDWWNLIDKNTVWKNHPDLLTFWILWKIPHIRVRREIKDQEKNEIEYEEVKNKILAWKIDQIVEDFYLRILSTTKIIKSSKSELTAKWAIAVLKNITSDIWVVTSIQKKRQVVCKCLDALYDSKYSIQLIKAKDFSYDELSDLIEV